MNNIQRDMEIELLPMSCDTCFHQDDDFDCSKCSMNELEEVFYVPDELMWKRLLEVITIKRIIQTCCDVVGDVDK